MDRRRLLLALLWPTALVVLVGVLAFFQYRWLGQVSEADRERQRTTLNQRAREFAADFDREIGRVYSAMQFDASANANADATIAFAKRYADWRDTDAFPELIRAVYLTDPSPAESAPDALGKFDPGTAAFSPVEWPASLAPVREHLATMRHRFSAPTTPFSSAGNTTFRFVSFAPSPLLIDVPALVIPAQSFQRISDAPPNNVVRIEIEPRYLIVELDRAVLTGAVLPALVAKHLAVDDYRVEVVEPRAAGAPTPVYRKGLAQNVDLTVSSADASTSFFNVRMDGVREALAAIRNAPAAGAVLEPGNTGGTAKAPAIASSSNRMSIIVSQAKPGTDAKPDASAGAELKAAAERGDLEATLQNRTVMGGRGGAIGAATFSAGPGAWQLFLQHPAGSLDAAVAKARRRNLAISFGVLAVLSVSVFLISINAQRSQQLAAQQMDFVATVSHELRTPIAVIRSAAQNLSAGVIHDPARAKKYGELIDTEGRRLTDMVEEVLEFAGISSGKRQFAMAPSDIGRLTADVVTSCESLIREAGLTLEFHAADPLPLVNLDEPAYRRALNNLIVNALKYGADGGWLGVDVTTGPDERIHVAVSDRGRGIDARDLPHIFDAFYRGGYAKERQIHGNGLGLSLVKRIVDAHGGTVSVRTSPAGSTFTMAFAAAA